METITHAHLEALVRQVPSQKISRAYSFLTDLVKNDETPASRRIQFMRESREKRRNILAVQAQNMIKFYEKTEVEREEWQTGDFMDDYKTK